MEDSNSKIIVGNENNFDYFKNKNIVKSKVFKRNFGIDLLRIFSMINIIILHINLFSGQLALSDKDKNYKVIWRLEIMCYWAVNAFGLISGIVGYKKYKFSNLIYIWIQASFHSFFFSLYLFIINKIKIKLLILSLFPILLIRNWYVNAYFCMYLFVPFINYGITNLDRKTYKGIILFFFLFFSIYHIFSNLLINNSNYHFLNNGYSTLWLIILYISGGYFGKYFTNLNTKLNLKALIIWIFIFFISTFISFESFFVFKTQIFINYLSPTIIFQAISLVILFSKLDIRYIWIIKIISFFTPLTFNVTLIHLRFFTENIILKQKFFKWVNNLNNNLIFFKIYGLGVFLYFLFAFIDYIRALLFKAFKIKNFSLFVEKNFSLLIEKIRL